MAITRHYADHPEKGIYYHLEGIPSQVAGEAGADALRFEVGGRSGKWSARNGGFAVPPPVGTWVQVMFNDLGYPIRPCGNVPRAVTGAVAMALPLIDKQ